MRTYTATLYANDGLGNLGSSTAITTKLADLGNVSWTLDDQLTKVTPGDMTITVWDEDGGVWNWLENQIGTTVAGVSQVFPPWIVLQTGSTPLFKGLLDLAGIKRNLKNYTIELSAKDWSSLLTNITLEGTDWNRPLPKVLSSRTAAGPWTGTVDATVWNYGYHNILWFDPTTNMSILTHLEQEDTVTLTPGGTSHKVVGIYPSYSGFYDNGNTPYNISVQLAGFTSSIGTTYTISRPTATLGTAPYYSVTADTSATSHIVPLDTVDWITAGDILTTVSGATITVDDIDTERLEIICATEIGMDLRSFDKLYLSAESSETMIWQDAGDLIEKAIRPYGVDLSRLVMPTGSTPVLSWLPLANEGEFLRGVSDIEPTLTGVKVIGINNTSYTGSPDNGWTSASTGTRVVDWTCQQTSAPTYLMPDTTPAVASQTGSRNRVYSFWKNVMPVNLDSNWSQITAIYDASRTYPTAVVCHDYSYLRRLVITNPISGASSVAESRWNGTAWSGATTVSWPITGWRQVSAVPMIGTTATTGPVSPQGRAVLALCIDNGQNVELQLAFYGGSIIRLAVDAALNGAKLRTTPWGVFLMGASGYFGRVTFNGTALTLSGSHVGNASSSLMPSTFGATSATDIYCMGQLTTDPDAQGVTITQVHLYKLSSTPSTGINPVIRSEKVMTGVPRLAVMVRDPSVSGRLLGVFGNRLYQVSATLPETIERIRAIGMTGAELVEHIAQVLNAVVVPLPTGVLQIVSRIQSATASAVSVDRISVSQQRLSENFFSVVRVTGYSDDIYQDAYGSIKGGSALEISTQPCIWTEGGAYALALSYAEFFGVPRFKETHSWFHSSPDTAPVWESLTPWQIITVPGSSRTWFLTALSSNLVTGIAEATLLEKV